jgi:hypothetical protein
MDSTMLGTKEEEGEEEASGGGGLGELEKEKNL